MDFFRGGAAEGDVGETEFGDEASDELREVVPKETSGDHRGDDEHRNQAQQDSEGQCGGQNGGPVLRKMSIAIAENFEPSTDGPLHRGQLADWLGDSEAEPFEGMTEGIQHWGVLQRGSRARERAGGRSKSVTSVE